MVFTFVLLGAMAAPSQVPAAKPVLVKPLILQKAVIGQTFNTAKPAPQPESKSTSPMKPSIPGKGPPAFEVLATDESSLRVVILDSSVELKTSFGLLVLPVQDIRRLDIGIRLTEDDDNKIQAAIAKLTDADRKARLQGREAVLAMPAKSLPAVRRAKKSITDPEILSTIGDVESRLVAALNDKGEKEIMDRDTIRTGTSTFVGTIITKQFKVQTGPFGEQKLKLSDMQTARNLTPEAEDEEGELITLPPTGMAQYQGQFGKVYRVRITGITNGSIWGTGTYTLDSYLPMAAVHAGVIKPGETAIVKIKIVEPPNVFQASYQNGVGSANYGSYPMGAYEFISKKSE
ncbi:MAG: LCCL domain-containing protein [Gemmataceae bacterium]